MKTKKYIVVAAIAVLVVAAAVALTGCASMQGAWAQIGINADKITSVTLVRSSGVASVLKPLEGQEMTDFIAAFDAIESPSTARMAIANTASARRSSRRTASPA